MASSSLRELLRVKELVKVPDRWGRSTGLVGVDIVSGLCGSDTRCRKTGNRTKPTATVVAVMDNQICVVCLLMGPV